MRRQGAEVPGKSGGGDAVFDFLFAAPAFDFDFAEHAADDAAEETLEVRVVEVLERADGLFLVAFEEHEDGFCGVGDTAVEAFAGGGFEDVGASGSAGWSGGIVFGAVVDVVLDLIGDADGFAEGDERVFGFVETAGVGCADEEGDGEGRGGFATEDFEDLGGGERDWVALPVEFGSLAAAEVALAFAGDADHGGEGGGGDPGVGDETVAFADEEVTGVEGGGDAVFGVEGGFVVAFVVTVFDVVVDEGCFVEAFDGEGEFADGVGERGFGVVAEGLADGDGEEGPPAFSGAGEPVAGDEFGGAVGRAHEAVDFVAVEP